MMFDELKDHFSFLLENDRMGIIVKFVQMCAKYNTKQKEIIKV